MLEAQVSRLSLRTDDGSAASRPPRPYSSAREPPANPLEFGPPRLERGRRDDVVGHTTDSQVQTFRGCLFRDYAEADGGDARIREAYWPVPDKPHINTIMGHVEICLVLEREVAQRSTDSDDDEEEEDDCEDDDIVFCVTNRYVAVKVNYETRILQLRNHHAEDSMREISALQLVGDDHPNVLGCIDVLYVKDDRTVNVVMRYLSGGDLFEMIRQEQPIRESHVRALFRQLMEGVRYLHSVAGICHRDLSPENVMLDGPDGNQLSIIIDMGMCLRVPWQQHGVDIPMVTDISGGIAPRLILPQGTCGKLPYMSPEIYRNREPFNGAAIDVWTAGTILFCLLTRNRSYNLPHQSDQQFYWMTHNLPMLLAAWQVEMSAEAVDLLQKMLQVDPTHRLTIEQVFNHPWMVLE